MDQKLKPNINLPGLDEQKRAEITKRIERFEERHEPDLVNGGPGWVPRLESSDYVIAISVNLVIIIWLIVALV